MSQNDFVIASQSAPDGRADINSALQALASQNSGATAPTTTYANMIWYDTTNNQIKKRNEADSAWVTLFTIDDSNGNLTFAAPSVTNSLAVNTSNTSGQGIILSDDGDIVDLNTGYAAMRFGNGVQIYSANGGGTPVITLGSNGVISGNLASAVGYNQTWQSVARSGNVSYQNTTGKPIMIAVVFRPDNVFLQVSSDSINWVTVANGSGGSGEWGSGSVIVPNGHYYRTTGGFIQSWSELR
jgi:hypothetical protein